MLTYSNFLKARINKYVYAMKNEKLSKKESDEHITWLGIYMKELQKVKDKCGRINYSCYVHAAYMEVRQKTCNK